MYVTKQPLTQFVIILSNISIYFFVSHNYRLAKYKQRKQTAN